MIVKKWRSKKSYEDEQLSQDTASQQQDPSNTELTGDLKQDLTYFKNAIGHNSDIRIKEFQIGEKNIQIALVFVDGLANTDLINVYIINGLLLELQKVSDKDLNINEYIKNQTLSVCSINESNKYQDIISGVMFGSIAVLANGLKDGFLLGDNIAKTRSIEEPLSEALVRGPRLGFIENLKDNTALLRRYGKDQKLSIINFELGETSKKELVLCYMDDIANPQLIEEVKQRINKIKMDAIHDSGYIEQLIEDNYLSPFPQVQSTERPDRVMSALLEGRVALLLDGTPFALIVPVTFEMLIQSPEDYYERWIAATLIRVLRYFSAFISLFAPSLYVAFISFHQGLIPTKLVFHISATRGGVPFPPIIEALIMEIAIEILREAGLRLPKLVGQSLGIVGGLIIGQAAVEAGLVSPVMVIVVAVTAISSFTLPQYDVGIALRMLRFISMLFAAVYGLYGVILFFLLLCSHLVKLKSFGVPYLSPAVPYRMSDWKDFLIRVPLFLMKRRPIMLNPKESVRKK